MRSFYLFHVYFTVRRILYEIGGIESVFALSDDPTFKQRDNKYVIAAYKKIVVSSVSTPVLTSALHIEKTTGLALCTFGLHIVGLSLLINHYPDPDLALFDDERQTDRTKDDYKANGIYYVRNDQGADKQFEYFVPNYSQGITNPGLARINQPIEAYCYCILGAQARTRSSIQGVSGSAIETQRAFLDRIEESIVLKNISNSIQRYQEAIADTKTRLDFGTRSLAHALAHGNKQGEHCWLQQHASNIRCQHESRCQQQRKPRVT